MIDWAATNLIPGFKLESFRPKVVCLCDGCGKSKLITIRVKSKLVNDQMNWKCPSCVGKLESKAISNRMVDKWKLNQYRADRVLSSIKLWEDDNFKEKHAKSIGTYDKNKRLELYISSMGGKQSLKDHLDRIRLLPRHSTPPSCSSIQITLYSILDDLGIKYYREYPDKPADQECTIGPWKFDCVIPRENKTTLLIECNGDYWHSLNKKIAADKAKSSYIANNLSHQYEIKYLWEHEFKCKDKITETVKYWMGITSIETIDFDFSNIIINDCPASDYKLLLSKYHYLSNAGRGGIAYGAYLGEKLVACCIFSPPIRQNINTSGFEYAQTRELSRLCIHPSYQKKNFASWFISRCIKKLDKKYRLIISYCDTTFNHNGATYKACNFTQDSEVPPDYWYVDQDGWVMHKKTLYNHAVNVKRTERQFAEENGYVKIYGNKKLRFKLERT